MLSVAMVYELSDSSQSAVFIVLLSLLTVTFIGAVCLHGYSRRYAMTFRCLIDICSHVHKSSNIRSHGEDRNVPQRSLYPRNNLTIRLFVINVVVVLLYCPHVHGKATSQLVTRSCRHTVNSSPVNSSHARLVTQSTRHMRAHNKATSRNFFLLHAGQVAPRNNAQHGRRTYSK